MKRVFSLFDDYGELIKKTEIKGSVFREGWFVMYKEPLEKLILETNELSKVKVFLYITSQQTFEDIVMMTVAHISKHLKMSYKTAWSAVIWLEQNKYLKRVQRKGISGFLINPDVSTCGKESLQRKKDAWNRLKVGVPVNLHFNRSNDKTSLAIDDTQPDDVVDSDTGEIKKLSEVLGLGKSK